MDSSLPASSVHGILQARILEWVAIPFFRESSRPRDQSHASCTAGRFFTIWATKETPYKDTGDIVLESTHMTPFYFSYLFKGPISKYSHIPR